MLSLLVKDLIVSKRKNVLYEFRVLFNELGTLFLLSSTTCINLCISASLFVIDLLNEDISATERSAVSLTTFDGLNNRISLDTCGQIIPGCRIRLQETHVNTN
jgi:hypothetical protein